MAGARRRGPSSTMHAATETRQRISREAARLIAEEGINDYQTAKRKAGERLNLPGGRHLPSNLEIEQALAEHLQLFQGRELPERLHRLRRLAVEVMRLLERFEPRLVGPLLRGYVTRFSKIELHITANTPEIVAFFLQEQGIAFQQSSKFLRFGGERSEMTPVYSFVAEDTTIEVTVLSPAGGREAPLSPIDGRPMKRAPRKEVEALIKLMATPLA